MDNKFVRRGYNQAAGNYLKGRDQFKNDKYLQKLSQLLKPKSTILDIGCGAGIPIDSFLIDKGHQVIGIDISEKQIELAKNNVPEGRFEVKDMSDLKESEYQVDAIISFYAIFHTSRETHPTLFKKINSFLPIGGLILVSMGSSDWEGKESNFFGTEMYWSHYGQDKNRQIIQNTGFNIILDEIDTTGGEKHQIILAKKSE